MEETDIVLLIQKKVYYNRLLYQALLSLPIPLSLSLSPSVMILGLRFLSEPCQSLSLTLNNEIIVYTQSNLQPLTKSPNLQFIGNEEEKPYQSFQSVRIKKDLDVSLFFPSIDVQLCLETSNKRFVPQVVAFELTHSEKKQEM